MSLFEVLGIARCIWPGLVSALVAGAFFFAPHFSARLIEREAEVQVERITPLFVHILKSAGLHPRHGHSPRSVRLKPADFGG
jgi:hypothetical protein